MPNTIKNLIRALRLPFAAASVFPFVFGSLLGKPLFSGLKLLLGLSAVLGIYLIANLIKQRVFSERLGLSYRRLGQAAIFLFFGPALVIGGFFIQTQVSPAAQIVILSLPFGFLATAILCVNEASDFPGREKAFIPYYLLEALGFIAIVFAVFLGHLSRFSLICLLLLPAVLRAGSILRRDFANKQQLIKSVQLTVAVHNLAGIILILDLLL